MSLPRSAEIVVVGAGAVGSAIALHLARRGARDVAVIEKNQITHGSTWHAAGLVGQYRSAEDLARLMRASVEVMDEIQAETPIDWKRVGSLRIAASAARMAEFRAAAPVAARYGIDFRLIDAAEAARLFPLLSTEGVHGAAHVPGDGHVDPTSLTMAYAAEARRRGVRFHEGVTVTGFERTDGRVAAIETSAGRIACGTLVLAPGVWARPVGAMLGLSLPVASLCHQYAVTEKRPDRVSADLPALRDPDADLYVKPEVGGFAIGGWEVATVPTHPGDIPFSFGRELLPDSLERLEPILERAIHRIPIVGELGLRTIVNGPIPVTPDGEPILGPAPGWSNLHLAIGFTSGIAASGGAGRLLAGWILDGRPEFPLPSLDPARFGTAPIGRDELNRRAITAYARYYALPGGAGVDSPARGMSS